VLKFNIAESVRNKFVIETKTSLDSGSDSTSTDSEPSAPQTAPSPLELTQPDLPTITKHTPQIAPCPSPNSELTQPIPSLPAPETTAHLGGGLALHDHNLIGMDWQNSTQAGGWDFTGLGIGDGMGMVSEDVNNGLGWSLLDELMNPNLPLLPEALLPVPALPTQQFFDTAPPSIFPQPNVTGTLPMQQFISTASPSNFPQPSVASPSAFPQPIIPLATGSDALVPQLQGDDENNLAHLQGNDENYLAPGTDATGSDALVPQLQAL
jgi:hypothetical protein